MYDDEDLEKPGRALEYYDVGEVAVPVVVKHVARAFGVKRSEILGANRHRHVSRARKVAAFLLITRYARSVGTIRLGALLGGRHSSTLRGGARDVATMMGDRSFLDKVVEVEDRIDTWVREYRAAGTCHACGRPLAS